MNSGKWMECKWIYWPWANNCWKSDILFHLVLYMTYIFHTKKIYVCVYMDFCFCSSECCYGNCTSTIKWKKTANMFSNCFQILDSWESKNKQGEKSARITPAYCLGAAFPATAQRGEHKQHGRPPEVRRQRSKFRKVQQLDLGDSMGEEGAVQRVSEICRGDLPPTPTPPSLWLDSSHEARKQYQEVVGLIICGTSSLHQHWWKELVTHRHLGVLRRGTPEQWG